MELLTYSSFLYGYVVTNDNFLMPFQEGAFERLGEIRVGSYTSTGLTKEISRAMNEAGSNEYLVSFDRVERKFTISSDDNFDLLLNTIYLDKDIYDVLGYIGTDKIGNNAYVSDDPTGILYEPQFKLQNFTDFEDHRRASSSNKNITASGNIEIIKFGDINIMSCDIKYITDKEQNPDSEILNNPNGKSDYRSFIEHLTDGRPCEFMQDKEDPNTYEECRLDKTKESNDGLDFKIKRMRQLFYHYESGMLEFRRL